MTHFEWTSDLETGNSEIDEQHKSLFALANELQTATETHAADRETVEDCVWQLTDYVTQHFADEQELMERAGYPALPVHIGLHDYLTGETMRMTARFMNGETLVPDDIAPFITTWLRRHIGEADRAFVEYLAAAR